MAIKKAVLWAIPVVVLGGLLAWRFSTKQAANAATQQQAQQRRGGTPSVEVAAAGPKTINRPLEFVGTVESPFTARISPKSAGRIASVTVREGAEVKPGQVLVTLDTAEIEGQILQQQAAVSEARSRLAQAQLTAGATGVGVESQIRQQQATVTSTQTQYRQTQEVVQSQLASARATVTDADAKVKQAEASVRNAEASLSAAEANLRNAKARYERVRRLYEGGFIAAQDVDDARTQVDAQQGQVDVARAQVSAAQSSVASAQAQRRSAQEQVDVVRRQGVATLANQRAAIEQARAGLSTATANRAQTPAYQQNLAALQASVDAAEGQLRQAIARRQDTVLTSPIEGSVTARAADPGSLASPGTPVVTVQYLKWLYVTANAPVEESAHVKAGQTVTVSLDAFPGEDFTGRIVELNPAADPQSRQITFRVRLENPQGRIHPGMYARVQVVVDRVDAKVAVPLGAVKTTTAGSTVTLLNDQDEATTVPVEIGAQDGDFVEIKSGVVAGQRVVTLAYSPVRDGQKVKLGRPKPGDGGEGRPRGGTRP